MYRWYAREIKWLFRRYYFANATNRGGINGSPPVAKETRLSRRSYALSCLHIGYLMITRAMRRIIILPSERVLGPASWMILITHDRARARAEWIVFVLFRGMKRLKNGVPNDWTRGRPSSPRSDDMGKKAADDRALVNNELHDIDSHSSHPVIFSCFPSFLSRGVISRRYPLSIVLSVFKRNFLHRERDA